MKQAVRGVCPRGDGHLCQGELTPQYEGCCSTKLALPALGLRVPLWRYVHHGMPRAKCTRSESATWLVAGGTICMFCPSTWARAFPKTQQEHGYLSREAKGKGNFPTQRLLLLLKKKKKCIHASKVTVTENWESFLSSGEDFAFEGHRCSSCSFGASMGSETQVSLSTPVWKCRTLLDCSGNEQHHPESPITLLARQEPGSMELSSCLCDKSCTSSQL